MPKPEKPKSHKWHTFDTNIGRAQSPLRAFQISLGGLGFVMAQAGYYQTSRRRHKLSSYA